MTAQTPEEPQAIQTPENRGPERGALAKIFQDEERILAAYLFGSRAKGYATPESDYDIAVLLSETPRDLLDFYLRLLNKLTDTLGDNVDLVILNEAPPELKYQVVKHGKPIYVRNERARVAFESRTIREYLDFSRILKRYDECLAKRLPR
ncbi:MAG: nucleotidyltransferase domain-containing protein [Thermofilaceae archaeon]